MTFNQRIREELCKARGTFINGLPHCGECCYKRDCDISLSTIQAEVRKVIGEDMKVKKVAYRADQAMNNEFVDDEKAVGYNQRGADILKRLEE
jgi:hypothetical protein